MTFTDPEELHCYETRIAIFTEGKREPTQQEIIYARMEVMELRAKLKQQQGKQK